MMIPWILMISKSFSSSDKESNKRHQKFKKFRTFVDMHDPKFDPRMAFDSKAEFKKAVQNFKVNRGRVIHFKKNDKTILKQVV